MVDFKAALQANDGMEEDQTFLKISETNGAMTNGHTNVQEILKSGKTDGMVNQRPPPIFVGIAGGTASGKTTCVEEIFERVRVGDFEQSTMIPLDCFYKECTPEQMENIGKVNFDHPSMFDWDLVKETFNKLRNGEDVEIPDYNYITCKRNQPGLKRKWSPLIMFEGIFSLYDKELNDQMDLKIFVHTDDDIRLARRIKRDIVERGRTVEGVLKSYHRFVKPAF